MKTETEIAKDNIETLRRIRSLKLGDDLLDAMSEKIYVGECKEHKTTCQRWLKWLEELLEIISYRYNFYTNKAQKNTEEKIQDLKQVIKLYEENEI